MRQFDFFSNIGEFKEVVPGVDSSTQLSEMQASYELAKQCIQNVIPDAIWALLLTAYTQRNEDPVPNTYHRLAMQHLQGALGNRVQYHHLIFLTSGKRKEDGGLYKYEYKEIQDVHLDSYWAYMDKLLAYLDANTGEFAGWTDTDTYKDRQSLFITSPVEFSKAYGIDGSNYFYARSIYLQLEVIDEEIASRVKKADLTDKPVLKRNVHRVIAYRTMAKAVLKFDFSELPKGIRTEIFNEWTKTKGFQEKYVKDEYANRLNAQADKYLDKVDFELNKPEIDVSEISVPPEDLNKDGDLSYVMT